MYGAEQTYIRSIEISAISSTAGMWHPLAGLSAVVGLILYPCYNRFACLYNIPQFDGYFSMLR